MRYPLQDIKVDVHNAGIRQSQSYLTMQVGRVGECINEFLTLGNDLSGLIIILLSSLEDTLVEIDFCYVPEDPEHVML